MDDVLFIHVKGFCMGSYNMIAKLFRFACLVFIRLVFIGVRCRFFGRFWSMLEICGLLVGSS